MIITNSISKIRQSIRWNLFFTLAIIMFVCQIITVIWLWHESKEQIDVLVDLTLNQNKIATVIEEEEIEAIFALFCSAFTMMCVTMFLSYKAITSVLNNLFIRLNDTLYQERLFTADVAHELRTPLAGIRLHLELLESKNNIDCSELIERIDRLVGTVAQLLMLARASQKFTAGQYQHIKFYNDIEIPLSDELSELVSQKEQALTWSVANKALSFEGDATLIRLLIRNLVENAYRYSPNNSAIEIICYQENDNIIIAVQDEGGGIDETQCEKLTQAFFRMDRKHDGIGLGLSIVNRIAKLHHGCFLLANRHDGQSGAIAKFTLTSQHH